MKFYFLDKRKLQKNNVPMSEAEIKGKVTLTKTCSVSEKTQEEASNETYTLSDKKNKKASKEMCNVLQKTLKEPMDAKTSLPVKNKSNFLIINIFSIMLYYFIFIQMIL